MPEPGQTPSPQFKRGQSLDYGEASSANALQALLQQPEQPVEEYQPQGPEEFFLFSPTDRPMEPITHGAPFGPGGDFNRYANEDDQSFMTRIAGEMVTMPSVSTEVKKFTERIAKGL